METIDFSIQADYDGEGGTQVTNYKVVDKDGNAQFFGSYTECHYFLYPNIDNERHSQFVDFSNL